MTTRSRQTPTVALAGVLSTGILALGIAMASPADADIPMSPDTLRAMCRKAGGFYAEFGATGNYSCVLPNDAQVQCPKGATTSSDCAVVYQDGTSDPPLPGFPPKPEANAPDGPTSAGPPVKGPLRPPTGEVG